MHSWNMVNWCDKISWLPTRTLIMCSFQTLLDSMLWRWEKSFIYTHFGMYAITFCNDDKNLKLSYGTIFMRNMQKNGEKTLPFVLHPKQINISTFVIFSTYFFFRWKVSKLYNFIYVCVFFFVLRQMWMFVNWVHRLYLNNLRSFHSKCVEKTRQGIHKMKTLLLGNILIRCKPIVEKKNCS